MTVVLCQSGWIVRRLVQFGLVDVGGARDSWARSFNLPPVQAFIASAGQA